MQEQNDQVCYEYVRSVHPSLEPDDAAGAGEREGEGDPIVGWGAKLSKGKSEGNREQTRRCASLEAGLTVK